MIKEGYVEPVDSLDADNFDQNETIQFHGHTQDKFVEPFIQTKPVKTQAFPETPEPVQPEAVESSPQQDFYDRRQIAMTPAVTTISEKEFRDIPIVVEDVEDTMLVPQERFSTDLPEEITGLGELNETEESEARKVAPRIRRRRVVPSEIIYNIVMKTLKEQNIPQTQTNIKTVVDITINEWRRTG